MPVDLRQTHFRFGKDDGTESAHTWWELEDVNHTQLVAADWTFLLRFTEQEMGAAAAANTDAVFQYNKNGAGWVDITTTSSVVKAVAVNAFTNGQACTKRLSGTGTFETSGAGCTEDGSSGGPANDIAASGNSETEAGLSVIAADVANGDTIQFRFRSPDWTVTYTVTPTLTIQTQVFEYGAATLSGTGILAGIGKRNRKGVATLIGSGVVAAIGRRVFKGVGTLAGNGAVAAIGKRTRKGVAVLVGTGGVAAIGKRLFKGTATLSGSGVVAAVAKRIRSITATLAGSGNLSSIGRMLRAGAVTLAGVGNVAAIAEVIQQGTVLASATLSGVGNLVVQAISFVVRVLAYKYSERTLYTLTASDKRQYAIEAGISQGLTLTASDKRQYTIKAGISQGLTLTGEISRARIP